MQHLGFFDDSDTILYSVQFTTYASFCDIPTVPLSITAELRYPDGTISALTAPSAVGGGRVGWYVGTVDLDKDDQGEYQIRIVGDMNGNDQAHVFNFNVTNLNKNITLIGSELLTMSDLLDLTSEAVTLLSQFQNNKKEFNLTESRLYLYDDVGTSPLLYCDLTDTNDDPVTIQTQGPINVGPWTEVP